MNQAEPQQAQPATQPVQSVAPIVAVARTVAFSLLVDRALAA
jgi:hypothetical protein